LQDILVLLVLLHGVAYEQPVTCISRRMLHDLYIKDNS